MLPSLVAGVGVAVGVAVAVAVGLADGVAVGLAAAVGAANVVRGFVDSAAHVNTRTLVKTRKALRGGNIKLCIRVCSRVGNK
jgi:N-acyl-D-aspartate/D-glutamate deacylase